MCVYSFQLLFTNAAVDAEEKSLLLYHLQAGSSFLMVEQFHSTHRSAIGVSLANPIIG